MSLFVLAICCMLLVIACNPDNPDEPLEARCKPVKVTLTGNGETITRSWTYDEDGNLLTDSINANGTEVRPWKFEYYPNNEIIIRNGREGEGLAAQVNSYSFQSQLYSYSLHQYYINYKEGFPVIPIEVYGYSLKAKRQYVMDSILFKNGNLVSCRITTIGDTVIGRYHFTYDTDMVYQNPYDPTDKLYLWFDYYPLSPTTPSETFGEFNPQPFSKNLLKTITAPDGTVSTLTYEFDSQGNVTRVSGRGAYDERYEYLCQ